MIPDFYDGYFLPDGDHDATWSEVQARFSYSPRRIGQCNELSRLLMLARGCGFRAVYLFGSFISAKPDPGDIDMLWVFRSGAYDSLSDRCKDLLNYAKMKEVLSWDVFCSSDEPENLSYLLSGWRTNKTKDKARGIIRIDLERFEGIVS